MRRVHKEEIWDPSYPAPPPIARRRARIAIPERCAYDGEVLLPLDEDAVRAGIRRLHQFGCTSIAVMYLFSFVNPDHERRTLELIREEFPDVEHVSLSHEVMSAGPEFERVSTTLVNAYVAREIRATPPASSKSSVGAPGYGRRSHDHAGHRRGDAAGLRGQAGGHAARVWSRPAASWPHAVARQVWLASGRSTMAIRGRHGRHVVRHLPRARRPARGEDRSQLALPLLHRHPDGRRAERRCRRWLHRPSAPRRAARRSGVRRLGARARVLQPRRRQGDRHRRRRRARLPAGRGLRGWAHDARRRRIPRRDRARCRGAARRGRGRSGVGHRADRERQHGQRHAARAGVLRRRPARPGRHRLRRQRPAARVRAGHGARRDARPRPEGGAGVLGARSPRGRLRRRRAALLRRARSAKSRSTGCAA